MISIHDMHLTIITSNENDRLNSLLTAPPAPPSISPLKSPERNYIHKIPSQICKSLDENERHVNPNIIVSKKLSRPMHENYSAEILAEYAEECDTDILDDLGLQKHNEQEDGVERMGSKILREALENNKCWSKKSIDSVESGNDVLSELNGNDTFSRVDRMSTFMSRKRGESQDSVNDDIDGYDLAVELRLRMKRTGLRFERDFTMVKI